jgi:hypothetical protein
MIKFYRIVEREPENPALSSDGGDYWFGRTVATFKGRPFAVRHWTSAEFPFCPHEGRFGGCDHGGRVPYPDTYEGWENGTEIRGTEIRKREMRKLLGGEYAVDREHAPKRVIQSLERLEGLDLF